MNLYKKQPEPNRRAAEDTNYQMAQKYMRKYLNSVAADDRDHRENTLLLGRIDEMVSTMHHMQAELKELKGREKSNVNITESMMAQRYMEMCMSGAASGSNQLQESPQLLAKMDEVILALRQVEGEVAEVKKQNAALADSIYCMDITRLTIGIGSKQQVKRIPGQEGYMQSDAGCEEWQENMTAGSFRRRRPSERDRSSYRLSDDEQFREMFSPENRLHSGMVGVEDEPSPRYTEPIRAAENLPEPPIAATDPTVPTVPAPPAAPVAPIPTAEQMPTKKKKASGISIISNILFYLCLVILIVGAVAFARSEDTDKSLLGFRYYYIKTSSMVPVYPVGSVVITKVTDPGEVQVGDDITVYVGDGQSDTYLTHRVVEITKDQAGELAFRTKGVSNKSNDPTPFNAKLMVGKVIFCIPLLGTVMTFVRSQLWLVIGIFILMLALSFMLRLMFSKESDTAVAEQQSVQKEPKRTQQQRKEKHTPKFMAKAEAPAEQEQSTVK